MQGLTWKTRNARGRFEAACSVEIAAPTEEVFERWNRFEDFPRVMESVRRTKRISETVVLWDVDIAGRQLVWEARILERVPEKVIHWEASWGTTCCGEVRFEAVSEGRTRLAVAIEYEPRGLLERLGARFGLVDLVVARDLERFARFVEGLQRDEHGRTGAPR